jgi:pyridoxine 4-dehydrogenase
LSAQFFDQIGGLPAMLPIPGTSSLAHLEENMAAEKLHLSAKEWKKIEELARS